MIIESLLKKLCTFRISNVIHTLWAFLLSLKHQL